MNDPLEQLRKITKDCKDILPHSERAINEHLEQIKKQCSAKDYDFFLSSFKAAKDGSLDIDSFASNVKNMNHGS